MFVYYTKNNDDNDILECIESNIRYFNSNLEMNKSVFNNCVRDRYIIIDSNWLKIGKNKNELENGYYDLYIIVQSDSIDVYINKLFKEFDENQICDEIYVGELVDYITKTFDLKIDKKLFSNIIIDNYKLIRDINRKSVESVDKVVELERFSIKTGISNSTLLLKIGDK
jgi:hypothetical protein